MRIKRDRTPVDLKGALVVAHFAENRAEAGQRPEMAGLKRQRLLDVGERPSVVLLQVIDRGARVPAFDIAGLQRQDAIEIVEGKAGSSCP